jgi:transposase-like protein
MKKLFTKEQAKQFLAENDLKDAQSIADALRNSFKDLIQEALEAEMDNELGYSKYDWSNKETDNSRNGHHKKTVRSEFGNVELDVPQDKNGDFEPVIVPKNSREVSPSINDMILSMYSSGMSTPDINVHMKKIYGIDVSPELVSRITDKILPTAKEWQNRPLDAVYPIIFLDGMVFNVAENGSVQKKTAYIVYGINISGLKDILGIWLGEAESSKFWMMVLSEIRDRGVEDILIASVDGLKGFTEAIKGIFPNTEIQRCIIHHIRNCTKFVVHKDRKKFCADMKGIYQAINEDTALKALEEFTEKWGKKYPFAVKSWERNWDELMTFMKYPEEIKRLIYTTNPIEAFNRGVRKVTKTKTSFRTDESLFKLLYLVSQNISEKWTMPIHNWSLIFQQLSVYFEGRLEARQ